MEKPSSRVAHAFARIKIKSFHLCLPTPEQDINRVIPGEAEELASTLRAWKY
jgi:hypothetical protein